MDKLKMNLQLFADGGTAAGGDGGAAAAVGGDAGVTAPDAGVRKNSRRPEDSLGNVKYAIQGKGPQQVAPAQEAAEQGKEARKSFRDLIDGEYKEEADAYIQNIIRERIKSTRDSEAQLDSLKPLLEAIGKKFNVDTGDIDGMIEAVNYDEAELENEASMRGMSLESLKSLKAIQKKADAYDRIQAQISQRNAMQQIRQQHLDSIARQAEEVRAAYPGFDLEREIENPVFMRLTAPGGGFTAKQAYEAIHHREIVESAMQQQAERMGKAIQANRARPNENGMKGSQSPSTVKTDPRTFTREEREALKRLVESGQRVVLG